MMRKWVGEVVKNHLVSMYVHTYMHTYIHIQLLSGDYHV